MAAVVVPADHFLNIQGFEEWLPTVVADADVERATAWVNLFRYHRLTQVVSNATAALQDALGSIHAPATARTIGRPLAEAVSYWNCG